MPDGRITTYREVEECRRRDARQVGIDYGAPSFVDPEKFGLYMEFKRYTSPAVNFMKGLIIAGQVLVVLLLFAANPIMALTVLGWAGVFYVICKFDNWLKGKASVREREQAKRDLRERNEMWAARLNQSLRDEVDFSQGFPQSAWGENECSGV